MSRYQKEVERHLQADKAGVDAYSRQMYGMSAKDLELALLGLVDIANGRLPSGAALKRIEAEAKQAYGWGEKQVRSELQKAIDFSTDPKVRVHAYLSTNGRKQISSEYFTHALEMVDHAAKADAELSMQERMANSESINKPRDYFAGMQADKRLTDDSKSRNELRDIIRLASGDGILPQQKSLGYRQAEVKRAKHEVADRLERFAAKHSDDNPPSLRDQIKMDYELHAVNAASKDVGLGDAMELARDNHEAEYGHMDDSYDPLERLNDA